MGHTWGPMASVLDVAPSSALKDGEALSRALWWLQRTLGEAGQWWRAERVSPSDNSGETRGRCRASCTRPDPNNSLEKWKAGHGGSGAQEPLTLPRAAAEGHCPDPACQHWCHSSLTILFHSGRRCCPSNVQRRKLRLEASKSHEVMELRLTPGLWVQHALSTMPDGGHVSE